MLCSPIRVEYTNVMNTTPTTTLPRIHSWTSRYDSLRTLTRGENGVYLLEGYSRFTRGSDDPQTNWKMIDLEGGPYMTTGSVLGSELHISCDSLMFTPNTIITGLETVTPDQAAEITGRDPVFMRRDEAYVYVKITTTERNPR